MTVLDSFKSKTVAVFLVMAALGSCAAENENISTDSNLAQALTEEFLEGKTVLTCAVPCAFRHGNNRVKIHNFYKLEQWGELAEITLRHGSREDSSYYYLGRAAEGLGFNKAAKIYYKNAINERYKCKSYPFDLCEGLDIPSLARKRIKNI